MGQVEYTRLSDPAAVCVAVALVLCDKEKGSLLDQRLIGTKTIIDTRKSYGGQ